MSFCHTRILNEKQMIDCHPQVRDHWKNDSDNFPVFFQKTPDKTFARFRMIKYLTKSGIAGDIIDLGCGTGSNSINFAKSIKHLEDSNRKVYAFDNFEGYVESDLEESKKLHPKILKGLMDNHLDERWKVNVKDVEDNIKQHGLQGCISIVKGDIHKTTKDFKPESGSISMLYIDCNTLGAATAAIKNLEKYFNHGSLVFVDSGFSPPDDFLDGEKMALLNYSQSGNHPMFRTYFGNFSSFVAKVNNE